METELSKYQSGSIATSCNNRSCIDRAQEMSAQLEAYRQEAVNWRNKASEMELFHKQYLETSSASGVPGNNDLLSPNSRNGGVSPTSSPVSPNSEEVENMSEGQKELLIEKLRHRIERLERKLVQERQGQDRSPRRDRKSKGSSKQNLLETDECRSSNCLNLLEEMRRKSDAIQLENQQLSEANENVTTEIDDLR